MPLYQVLQLGHHVGLEIIQIAWFGDQCDCLDIQVEIYGLLGVLGHGVVHGEVGGHHVGVLQVQGGHDQLSGEFYSWR